MAGNLERAMSIIELLARQGDSMQLAAIADTLDIPRSATHRVLSELRDEGYVRQDPRGEYLLSLKMVSLGLIWLSTAGVIDISRPILDKLAEVSGELARLGIVEGSQITFVGKSQGAKSGLRYDPDMGSQPPLHCTASGQAWLSTLSDEDALALVSRQGGIGKGVSGTPKAPKTIQQFLSDLTRARKAGYGYASDTYEAGMTAIAAPIKHPVSHITVGIVSLAGPTSRLPDARVKELVPALLEAASNMSAAAVSSPYFDRSVAVESNEETLSASVLTTPVAVRKRGRPRII
ncbi:IclR family transcriptional regulator [Robbsia sp. KACC 23696]|uniref:IclR family transcriptional regulator n=1 Tax=Robbsia sp. KACC 23696 TaxID=3149231 RepID=UPI00325B4290